MKLITSSSRHKWCGNVLMPTSCQKMAKSMLKIAKISTFDCLTFDLLWAFEHY